GACECSSLSALLTHSSVVKFNFEPKKFLKFNFSFSKKLNKEKNLQPHLTNFENKILASSKLEYRVKEHKRKWSHRCVGRSEEHTSELQSRFELVCRLLLEKKKRRVRWQAGWAQRRSKWHTSTTHCCAVS